MFIYDFSCLAVTFCPVSRPIRQGARAKRILQTPAEPAIIRRSDRHSPQTPRKESSHAEEIHRRRARMDHVRLGQFRLCRHYQRHCAAKLLLHAHRGQSDSRRLVGLCHLHRHLHLRGACAVCRHTWRLSRLENATLHHLLPHRHGGDSGAWLHGAVADHSCVLCHRNHRLQRQQCIL